MRKQLGDTREETIKRAEELMKKIAMLTVDLAIEKAKHDKAVARAKDKLDLATEQTHELLDEFEQQLNYCLNANAKYFEKPRSRKTTWGSFGFRSATKMVIVDEDAIVDYAEGNDMPDLIEVVKRPVRSVITKRLKDGGTIPGAELKTGDIAFCKVDQTFVEEQSKKKNRLKRSA